MTDWLLAKAKEVTERDDIDETFVLSELDSLARVEIIVEAEERLGIQLTNEEIAGLETLEDLGVFIMSRAGSYE